MEKKISDILEATTGVEVACANDKRISYLAKIKLVMNSEIDFTLVKTGSGKTCNVKEVPFKKDDDILVILKTADCCYSYQEKCTYIKMGHSFTLSVKHPTVLRREQKREFVRTPISKDILIFIVAQNKRQECEQLLQNGFSINTRQVKSFDVSGGGIAFYDNAAIGTKTNLLVNLSFIAPELNDFHQPAEVLRCTKVKENEELYLIGARFVELSFMTQQKINRFVFAQIRERTRKKKSIE